MPAEFVAIGGWNVGVQNARVPAILMLVHPLAAL
jgi:hypothetical protein